jgi:hypothetical protein
VEALEDRQLLATATVTGPTFVSPSLSGLIAEADRGINTGPATINTMIAALQTQLTDGPLTDLDSGVVNSDGFITETQDLVSSYSQSVNQQLLPRFPHIDQILQLQGQRIVADLVSLNQQNDVHIITSTSNLSIAAQGAIAALAAGPILSLSTPISAYVTTTQSFETNLGKLVATLNSSSTPTLTLSQVNTTLQAEAEAYRTDMNAGSLVTHANIAAIVGNAVTTLEDTVNTIAAENSSTALSQLHTAIAQFDTTILDTTGLLGTHGPVNQASAARGFIPHNLTNKPASTTLSSVSGTGTFGGTATLTATLTSASGAAVVGRIVSFTPDGVFAGTALTDSSGVATLSGVPTSDPAGTTTGAVVASFAGDKNFKPSQATGDIVNSQSGSALNSVSGTATFGGTASNTATLTATLTSTTTSQPISGETVSFTLDGTSVGTATTDSNGVATLTATTTDTVGTHTGVVGASFAATSSFGASSGTGDLVVSPAATSVTNVSGTAVNVGGTTTLTATLNTTATGTSQPLSGQTINFILNGTSLGTATTGPGTGAGVATLSNVTITNAPGTDTITASFSPPANSNYAASSGTGSLVVNQATSELTSVSNSPAIAGSNTTTLSATLKNTTTDTPITGATVTFTVVHSGNTLVTQTATTDNSGLATTSPVSVSATGISKGDTINASYAGSTNNASTTGTGTIQ